MAGAPIGEKGVSGDLLTQEEAFVELEDESTIELQSNTPGNFIENPGTGIVFTPSLYKSHKAERVRRYSTESLTRFIVYSLPLQL